VLHLAWLPLQYPSRYRIVLREGLCTLEIIVRTAHQASSLPLVWV
jgi:hypothetical protein